MFIEYLFIVVCVLAFTLIAAGTLEIHRNNREHRQQATYVMDRRNGKIHLVSCSRVKEIPPRKRIYWNEWQLRSHRDRQVTSLNLCRLCVINKNIKTT